jgi:hypothetical protein
MDPKRKRLYFIIIAICLLLAVVIFLWGGSLIPSFGGGEEVPTNVTQTDATPRTTAPGPDGSYPPPAVFPANTKLDVSVFESGQFTNLKVYNPVTIDPSELGRDDPYRDY